MTDKQPADNSRGGSQDSSELDGFNAVLDRASSMVADLLKEIGDPETTQPLPEAKPPAKTEQSQESPAKAKDPPATEPPVAAGQPTDAGEPAATKSPAEDDSLSGEAPIDDQLDKLDGLLDETEAQLGGAGPDESEAASSPDTKASPESSRPESGQEPGVHPIMGDLGGTDDVPTLGDDIPSLDGEQPPPGDEQWGETAGEGVLEPIPATGWWRIAAAGTDVLTAALDLIDRPFVQLSYGVRQILSLCALVILLGAIATFIISHF